MADEPSSVRAARLRQAFDLCELGESMRRTQLRRERPEATDQENDGMSRARRVTAKLPEDLLRDAMAVSTPDADVAQCALDRAAVLLSRDAVFSRIASFARLRVRTS